MYSYTDPCTKELKYISADMNSPIVISYYGQVKAFSYTELQDGTFDAWLNSTYANYRTTAPCQGVFTTTTTTTSTNTVMGLVNNVMTLNSLTSLDLSSTTSSLGSSTSVGATTSTGTGGVSTKTKDEKSNDNASSDGSNSSTSDAGNSSNSGDQSSGQGSVGSSEKKEVSTDGSSSSSNSSSSSSSGGKSGSSGNGGNVSEKKEDKAPDKVEEQKTEQQKAGGGTSAKAAAKAKVETQKPAILVTGDIVGIQTAKSNAQDARATMSFTRVKGDGTSSFGLSTDYTINARIGNVSLLKSWIGENKKRNKHINVLSGAGGFMPKSFTSSLLFVRVNSLKNFTALYGASASYGKLFNQEIISTMIIGGFMYKGQITKHIDATIIAASVYAPYTKYYTESVLKSKPIIVPFLNINYSMTKTFKVGLTAGGTYIANQDIVNYQVLIGGKLKI